MNDVIRTTPSLAEAGYEHLRTARAQMRLMGTCEMISIDDHLEGSV